ncbi:MAG TPA: hypothetical protein VHR86_02430, partial [Armatimonadota bacterium]|nr:hypothetical protein [Armatimonadota bacterium]
MMRRFWLSMAVPLMVLVAAASGMAQQATVPVTVNPAAHYQTIRGWGATANKLSPIIAVRDQLLDTAINDLGLTRLRWEPPRREWEDVLDDDGDPYHIEWSAFKTAIAEEKAREIILPFKQRVEANGDPFSLYISPSFFDGGSTGSAPSWMLNNPAEYTEWATAFLLLLKQRYGIVPDYYCVCNEAGNNNAFTPERVGAIIKTLGPALRALGLPTRIQFPEGVNSGVSWRYIQTLRNDPAVWPYIGLLSYHLYGDGSARPLIRDFAAARGIPTAQTEFMGTTVDHLYEDLTQGNVSYWEHYGLAGPWGGNGTYFTTALNGTSFRPYSQYWNFRQVMHYVRPGAVRVEAVSGDPAVRTLAFTRQGKLTVVLINTAPAAAERIVTVSGLPDGNYGVCATVGNRP